MKGGVGPTREIASMALHLLLAFCCSCAAAACDDDAIYSLLPRELGLRRGRRKRRRRRTFFHTDNCAQARALSLSAPLISYQALPEETRGGNKACSSQQNEAPERHGRDTRARALSLPLPPSLPLYRSPRPTWHSNTVRACVPRQFARYLLV